MDDKKVTKGIKLKEVKGESIEQEVEGALNVIKGKQIQNGIIPETAPIRIQNFAGKVLKIDKSVVLRGKQYFAKKKTVWEDITPFLKKHIKFSDSDFK